MEKPENEKRPNVVDEYKQKFLNEIRQDLDTKRSKVVNICKNLTNDFNKASVIRLNNAFCCREFWVVGRKKMNRRGTVGTHLYEHVKHYKDLDCLGTLIDEGYTIYPVENRADLEPIPIYEMSFPEKSAFFYGEEMEGLTQEDIDACNGSVIYIPQYGSVRSINVAQAAAIVNYEYARQHRI